MKTINSLEAKAYLPRQLLQISLKKNASRLHNTSRNRKRNRAKKRKNGKARDDSEDSYDLPSIVRTKTDLMTRMVVKVEEDAESYDNIPTLKLLLHRGWMALGYVVASGASGKPGDIS